MKSLDTVTWWLVVVGALNWGTVGLLNLNLVETVLSSLPGATQVVYVLVGASAVYTLVTTLGKK